VDHRTDIYSLGLIFYESITGHPPFVGGTRRETMAMHVQAKHMPPSAMASIPCGDVIDAIVDRALAKHPDNRFQHVRELENTLKELLAML
jgi:serine/threonine protein kinase